MLNSFQTYLNIWSILLEHLPISKHLHAQWNSYIINMKKEREKNVSSLRNFHFAGWCRQPRPPGLSWYSSRARWCGSTFTSKYRIFEGISNFSCKCHPHRQLTCKSLLRETVALRQSVEELDHTLFLVQCGVALECLLDEATQLFGLMNETRPPVTFCHLLQILGCFRKWRWNKSVYLHAAHQLFGKKHV